MKILKLLSLISIFLLASCSSVKVSSDYDSQTDFSQYKTFAFYKKGLDKVAVSDLDKKRILKAIESELLAKGLTKSSSPDVLVNIFTKARERVDVYRDYYPSWGYRHWNYYGSHYGNSNTRISKYTEGTLFVDLIDAQKKELAWQGIGKGALTTKYDVAKKEERIKEFVAEIMAEYPPGTK